MRIDTLGSTQAAAPAGPISAEQALTNLVKFVESNPSTLEAFGKGQDLQNGPLAQHFLPLMQRIGPAIEAAGSNEGKLGQIKAGAALLKTMRADVAGGMKFELARAKMGTQNTMIAGLLGTAVDTPFKMDLCWAGLQLSAIVAQGAINGELGSIIK
jgi:hypothetical protein